MALKRFLLFGGAALLLGGCAAGRPGFQDDFQVAVQQATGEVYPAVVYIHAIIADTSEGADKSMAIRGSGVIISPTGEVLTNFHVADKARTIRCQLNDSSAYEAEIVGFDKDVDLALLQLKLPEGTPPLPYAELETIPVREGEFVMALGAPWGLNRSVSMGMVSCADRYLSGQSEYSLWIQTDATISPGNSGGPLVNTAGKIVGINTLSLARQHGFSIPAATIADLVPRLREYKEANWAWLGLELQPLTDFDQNIYFDFDSGVIVAGTQEDSPARLAGILPKDRIVGFNGAPVTVRNIEAMPDFRRAMALLPFDVPVRLQIDRGGEMLDFELTPRAKGQVEGDELVLKRWRITVKAINRFNNPDLFFFQPEGVFVHGFDYWGSGYNFALRFNDIILKVNGRPVKTLEELEAAYEEAIAQLPRKTSAVLTVMRGGSQRQLVLDFSDDVKND